MPPSQLDSPATVKPFGHVPFRRHLPVCRPGRQKSARVTSPATCQSFRASILQGTHSLRVAPITPLSEPARSPNPRGDAERLIDSCLERPARHTAQVQDPAQAFRRQRHRSRRRNDMREVQRLASLLLALAITLQTSCDAALTATPPATSPAPASPAMPAGTPAGPTLATATATTARATLAASPSATPAPRRRPPLPARRRPYHSDGHGDGSSPELRLHPLQDRFPRSPV